MGGNALKKPTRRFNKSEYNNIENEILLILRDLFPGRKINSIPSFGAKDSFGDLDILIENPHWESGYDHLIQRKVDSPEWYYNHNVRGFWYNEFQIDLILANPSYYEFAYNYYSYNDLGNLLGRQARRQGLKYGHKGLFYPFYNGKDHKVGEILLTTNTEDALEFLGYDFKRFKQGFNELEDIFKYVLTSKYFNPDAYLEKNRPSHDLRRDKKRPNYMSFIDFVNNKETNHSKVKDRKYHFERMKLTFPHVIDKMNELVYKDNQRKLFKKKFNGKLVSSISGFEQEPLGKLMKKMSQSFTSKENFQEFILSSNDDEIISWIKTFLS